MEWASENRRSVIVTASLLLAAIVLFVVGFALYSHREDSAAAAFGAAMQAYQTPIAQAGQPVPPGVRTYPGVTERARAANAQFMAVASQYSLMPDGRNARYFGGLTYMEAGQNASAESTLKQVADGWNSNLAGLAKLALSQLYRQTGRDAQAVAILNELTSKPTTTVPAGLAQLEIASVYESQGKVDAARKIYAQLKDKDAKGPAGAIAAQKLNPSAAAPQAQPQ